MKPARVLVMFAIAAIVMAVVAGCSGSSTSKGGTQGRGGPPVAGPSTYIQDIQAGIEPQLGTGISAADAKAQTGISVRVPKSTNLTGALQGIYPSVPTAVVAQSQQNDAHKLVTLMFKNGIALEEEVCPTQPNWAAEAAVPTMNGKPPDAVIGAAPVPATIAGFQGMVTPEWTSPGPSSYKLPPQLQWWENGVRYHILPWKLGFTSDQLMTIVKSMY